MISEIRFKKEELYDRLKGDILLGRYTERSRLPKEVDLSRELGVARGTLRNVLDLLEKEGLLVRLRSKGTFITSRKEKRETRKILILLDMNEKADMSWPSNYILPGIEGAAGSGTQTETCPLQFVLDMDIDSGVKFLQNSNAHGFVIFGGRFTGNENYILMLQKLGCPVVMAGCFPRDVRVTGFAAVRTNRREAWQDGVKFLKGRGHRHIATLTYACLQGYEEDYAAYQKFLEDEMVYRPELIKVANYNYEEIRGALENLMRLGQPPTAIMCYSDFYAMHLLRAAKELGVRIPENLAVMGYSGFPGTEYLDPPLATVDFHYPQMGETALRILERSSEWFDAAEQTSPPDVVIPHEVVIRRSVQTGRLENTFDK